MQVVVLAGDLPSSDQGDQVPQSLLLVHGRPLIDWQLDCFVASGARSVVMCVGHLGEQIETHVRRALDRGLAVSYSYEGDGLIGTGGALRRAFARLDSEFVLTYGGSYLPFDYAAPLADLTAHPAALATMTVCKNLPGSTFGQVTLDGDWVTQYEIGSAARPLDAVDCGAIALRRSTLSAIEDGAVWGIEALFRQLARKRQLRAFTAPERFYDASSLDGRGELERHLQQAPQP